MEWKTPKTNWYGFTNPDGTYSGDRFNADDFNRIKNNLDYLHDLACKLYESFAIESLGDDRTPADYLYADEINQLEENLKVINKNTVKYSYGTPPVYKPDGKMIGFMELNRLESAILDLYNKLNTQYYGRRMLTWNFETKGEL